MCNQKNLNWFTCQLKDTKFLLDLGFMITSINQTQVWLADEHNLQRKEE